MNNEVDTNLDIPVSRAYVRQIVSRLLGWLPFTKKQAGKGSAIVQNNTEGLTVNGQGEIALGQYNNSTSNTLLSIGVGDIEHSKNAVEVTRNGELFILYPATPGGEGLSLQKYIDDKSTVTVDTYADAAKYIKNDCFGKVIILEKGDPSHKAGLYMVTMKVVNHNPSAVLTRIAEVPANADTWAQAAAELNKKMQVLEEKVLASDLEPITQDQLEHITQK